MFIGSMRLFTSNSLAALPLEACYNDKPFTKLDSIYATQYTHSAFKISIFEDQEKTHTLPWNILYMKLLFSLKKLKKKKKTDGTWTSHRLLLKFCFFFLSQSKSIQNHKIEFEQSAEKSDRRVFQQNICCCCYCVKGSSIKVVEVYISARLKLQIWYG